MDFAGGEAAQCGNGAGERSCEAEAPRRNVSLWCVNRPRHLCQDAAYCPSFKRQPLGQRDSTARRGNIVYVSMDRQWLEWPD